MNPFTSHPSEVGETYFQHLRAAARIGARLCWAGLACFLHAVLPFAFKRTGSRTVMRLYGEMASRGAAPGATEPGRD